MIKFIRREHTNPNKQSGKVVIYYSVSDVFLGITLLALVIFFINDYLSHRVGPHKLSYNYEFESPNFSSIPEINISTKNP